MRQGNDLSPRASGPFADFVAWTGARTVTAIAKASTSHHDGSTRTGRLLNLLELNGRMTTRAIADETGLDSNLVWGLLKAPRANGQVRFEEGHWSLDNAWPGTAVLRAVELLRSKGWLVEPPITDDYGPNARGA